MQPNKTINYEVPSLSSQLIGELSHDHDLTHFRGIPYATLTKRWTHSTPLNTLPSPSPFNATNFGPRCPQLDSPPSVTIAAGGNLHSSPSDHEFDCLNLNITVPTRTLVSPSDGPGLLTLLPVMVWVHGGAFLHGSSSRPRDSPSKLLRLALTHQTPTLHISIQYRLNILGFASSLDLSTEHHRNLHPSHLPPSGNYGLIDQRNAFLWIQNHIQGFGGDPENVTAVGISAGSASVHLHILNGDPLFDRAIMMSGSAPVLGPLPAPYFQRAWEELCDSLNVSELSLDARLEKLRSLEVEEILKCYTKAPMGPMRDGIFLPLNWDVFAREQQQTGMTRCKSVMVGDTRDDGVIVDYISANISQARFLQDLINGGIFKSPADIDTFLVYFGIRKEEMGMEEYRLALRFFFSVLLFQYPNFCVARGFGGKAYLYHFDEPSVLEGEMTEGLCYHGQCATYLFQNCNEGMPEEHVKLAEEMGKIWTAFASGKSKPWEEFGKKERYIRFGPGGKSEMMEVKDDESRDYAYLEWLEGHREETRALFTFVSEMVECKLLKQENSTSSASEASI